jgi:hypothetical protein
VRTTLTLEADVAAALKRVMRKRRGTMKAVVNEALRQGLEQLERPAAPASATYRVEPWNLGGSLVGSLDNVEEVLSRVEGEAHR